ncbi:MAG: L,D-transpeptidase family protein [Longimicrobiales bacterium]
MTIRIGAFAIVATLSLAGCAHFTPVSGVDDGGRDSGSENEGQDPAVAAARDAEARMRENGKRHERREGPSSPALAEPEIERGRDVWRKALSAGGRRIVISVDHRWLWLMENQRVLLGAPVAVGTSEPFSFRGTTYDFKTPRAEWRVQAKAEDRLWVPPNWHYFEVAAEQDLEPIHLKKGQRVGLSDSTVIEVRGDEVGRVNRFGNFWPFTPGAEIIFDGKVFIPPIGTRQREIPEILGTHALELGDGYLIHGTNEEDSIGEAVSHGCVRMYNEDVAALYAQAPIGTRVYVY